MTKLMELETTFQNYLLHDNPAIFQHVIGTNKVPIDVRLEIYGHAYRARLHDALAVSYPVLQDYLGEEQFETLCLDYINDYPSPFRSIRWFGDHLPAFLQSYEEFPYLAELAQFEWTMALVFDAADKSTIQLEHMQQIPPEQWNTLRLQTHPSIHRLTFSWNVIQIWQAINDEQTPDEPQQSSVPIEWILWRNELISQFSSLPADEAWAIDAMINNQTFGEICEGLCQWVDEANVGMHAASLLKGWITAGLITNIIYQ